MKRTLFVFGLFLLMMIPFASLHGQYYDGGHSPPTVRWRVISGGSFDLLFADTMERQAQQLAAYLDTLLPVMEQQYGRPLRRLPIVLHNGVTSPNAFVGWAPSRMEFFTMPPSDGEAHDWLEQLAIHESTHWFQFSQMYQGSTRWLSLAFGEQVPALVMGLFMPYWLIEGDAVYQETALSSAGRGRDADFERLLRTRMVTQRRYTLSKAVLGSYRDRTPGPYETGYHLAAFGREQYGDHLWDSVYRYIARNWWLITPTYWGLNKYTGKGTRRLYRDAMTGLSNHWRTIDTTVYWDTASRVIAPVGRWGEYHRPQAFMQDNLLAEYRHPGVISSMVAVSHDGEAKHLFYPGHTLSNPVSYSNGRVLYTAWSRHPRWPNVQFSDVWVYDFAQDTLMQLTRKGRYGGAVADPIVGEIYTMRYRPDHRHELVRMTGEGEVLAEWVLPQGYAPAQPGWWPAQDRMLYVAVTPKGKAIFAWDGLEEPIQVSPFTHANIGNPTGYNHGVLFHAPHYGIDQVFLLVPDEEKTYRITQSRFGARYPALDVNGDLLFSEVLPQGIAISALPSDEWFMEEVAWPELPDGFRFADRMPQNPMAEIHMSDMCDSCFAVEPFKPFRNLFRIHSWAPVNINPVDATIQPGISVMSQNTLSTAFLLAGIRYHLSSPIRTSYVRFTYQGFWPVINLGYDFTRVLYYATKDDPHGNFHYGIHTTGVTVELPLTSTRGQWNRHLNVETGVHLLALVHMRDTYEEFPKGELVYGTGRIYTHLLRRMAVRDLYPKWGYVFVVTAMGSVKSSFEAGEMMALTWVSYYPGAFKNHGIRIYLAAQKRNRGRDLQYNRLINTPRGYHDEVQVDNGAALQANYKMPLLYPDLALGPLIYLKRITGTVFYDHLILEKEIWRKTIYSYGFEVGSDFHLLRHFAPMSLAVGNAFRKDGKQWRYLAVNINL